MLIVGDLHVGLSWDGLDRSEDIFSSLEWVILQGNSDTVVFLGDIFDSVNVSHGYISRFIALLASDKNKRRFIILSGNHDGSLEHRKGSPLQEVEASGVAEVVWEPKLITGVGYMIPYTFDEIKESEVPLGVDVFCHVDIPGAIPGFEVKIGRGLPVPLPSWVAKKAYRIFGGHIHTPQQLGNITIVGSLISTDISEAGEVKRVVRTKPNSSDFESILIDNRPLLSLDVVYGTAEYTKNLNALLDILKTAKNAIVSVKITCPHTEAHKEDWVKLEETLRSSCHYLRWNFNVVKAKEIRVKDLDLTKTDGEIVKEVVTKQKLSDEKEVLVCFEEILA